MDIYRCIIDKKHLFLLIPHYGIDIVFCTGRARKFCKKNRKSVMLSYGISLGASVLILSQKHIIVRLVEYRVIDQLEELL